MPGRSSLALLATPTCYGLAMLTKAPPQSENPSNFDQGPPRVDVERFRADLRDAGIEDMIGSLLATFIEDSPLRFAALEQAVKQGNAKAIESAAHAFKSGAGTIRATFLADGLAATEAAARAGNLDPVTALLEQIRNEYLAVVRQLETTQTK